MISTEQGFAVTQFPVILSARHTPVTNGGFCGTAEFVRDIGQRIHIIVDDGRRVILNSSPVRCQRNGRALCHLW